MNRACLQATQIEANSDTFTEALTDTLQLARRYRLSSYDVSYLKLVLRAELPLATGFPDPPRSRSRPSVYTRRQFRRRVLTCPRSGHSTVLRRWDRRSGELLCLIKDVIIHKGQQGTPYICRCSIRRAGPFADLPIIGPSCDVTPRLAISN